MEINDKIRFFRENKNWSQEEMAQKLGMSTQGYAKIERGENSLNFQRLEEIAKILEVNILELLFLGERNVVFFQESINNNNLSIIQSSHDLAFEIRQLKSDLAHQKEIIEMKNEMLASKNQEIAALKALLEKQK